MKFKKGETVITTFNQREQEELKAQGYEVLNEEIETANKKVKKGYNE